MKVGYVDRAIDLTIINISGIELESVSYTYTLHVHVHVFDINIFSIRINFLDNL